jgi:hypothetical protein
LQGATSATAVAGLVTFTNLSHNVATNITVLFTSGTLTNTTSGTIAISAAAADHLTIQTQPSTTATAGVAFAQQPVLRIEDAFGNRLTSDNSTVVTATRSTGTGSLQGTTTATASAGVVTFANLSYNVAETITINFTSGSLTNATSGNIVVSPSAANRLTIQTQPSPTATAGAAIAPQPVIRIEDQFGNLRSSDNSTVVTAARGAGSGTLQGTTSMTAVAGVVTFTNLSHNVATNITISFTGGSLTGATSDTVAVSPATVSKLVFATQPGSATAGAPFGVQPALKTQDAFGNDSINGLAANLDVTITLSAGTGPLLGTTTLDIGAYTANGFVSFTDLEIDAAGTNKQLTATSSGLTSATSTVFTVSAAAANHLTIQTQPPSTAAAGVEGGCV